MKSIQQDVFENVIKANILVLEAEIKALRQYTLSNDSQKLADIRQKQVNELKANLQVSEG